MPRSCTARTRTALHCSYLYCLLHYCTAPSHTTPGPRGERTALFRTAPYIVYRLTNVLPSFGTVPLNCTAPLKCTASQAHEVSAFVSDAATAGGPGRALGLKLGWAYRASSTTVWGAEVTHDVATLVREYCWNHISFWDYFMHR